MGAIHKIIFFSLFLVAIPSSLDAASLYFSPRSGTQAVGTTFTVAVYIESADKAMNAASGVVSFPWDKLEVVSLSKSGSIFSLWPTEPSFSNSQGTVSFEGIVLNPGYTGANGRVLTITFRVRNEGDTRLNFSSGSILANDGTGTNILKELGDATFVVKGAQSSPVSPVVNREPASGSGLQIISTTHPDQGAWYTNNTPEFSWQLPDETLEVRTLIGTSPSGTPRVSYQNPISKKKVDELPDGTYYFSLQARTSSGWTPISRYRVNIDTTSPKPFSIVFPRGSKGWESEQTAFFNTTDSESGISHYDVKIGSSGTVVKMTPQDDANPYLLPPQLPGSYSLFVSAVDKAGNIRNSSGDFTVESIDAPKITYFPDTLTEGEILKIGGTTYPSSDVTVFIYEGDSLVVGEYTKSNSLGDFGVVITKDIGPGVYTVTAKVKDGRGAQSIESSPLVMTVKSEILTGVISVVLKYLSVIVLVVASIGALIWVAIRSWLQVSPVIRRMRHEAREAEQVSRQAFRVLEDGVKRHIERLRKTKRKLSKDDLAFLEEFEDKLEEAKDVITDKIRDIS